VTNFEDSIIPLSLDLSHMKYAPIDPRLFVENRQRLLEMLPQDCIAVFHSADLPWRCADGSMRFIQSSDLYYLTGIDQEQTMLILEPGAEDLNDRARLFVRETSEELTIWEGEKLSPQQATEVSGIENIILNDQFEGVFRRLARKYDRLFLNHNEHPKPSGPMVFSPDDRFREHCVAQYPDHRFERVAPFLHQMRQAKSRIEVDVLQHACDITAKGFQRTLDFVKPGVMEYEIEAELIHEFIRHGSRGFAYEPIIATGKNACTLHYLTNESKCEDGQLILMDVAAEYAGYNSDLTRTIPANGKFTERQRAVYDAVYRIFRKCIDELMVPGKKVRDEYQREVARATEDELIGLNLIDADIVAEERTKDVKELPEEKRAYRKYFMHGTSHNLGLDVHDVNPPDCIFVENQVMTVEPGIYIPDEGFGVRLENDVVVKAGGNVDLMAGIPIEADEIEALMAEAAAARS